MLLSDRKFMVDADKKLLALKDKTTKRNIENGRIQFIDYIVKKVFNLIPLYGFRT